MILCDVFRHFSDISTLVKYKWIKAGGKTR